MFSEARSQAGPQVPYRAEGASWSLPGQQYRERNYTSVSQNCTLILYETHGGGTPVWWPVTQSTTSYKDKLFCRVGIFQLRCNTYK